MTDEKMIELRQALESRRAELLQNIDHMSNDIRALAEDESDEGAVGNHLADDGSNVMEGESLATISEDLQEILTQTEAALRRMDEGTFGICQRCGQPIGAERLEGFPYVAYCITCQGIVEREQALFAGR